MPNMFTSLIATGSGFSSDSVDQRNIRLTNFLALIMASALVTILLFRAAQGKNGNAFFIPLSLEILTFFGVVLLNRNGFTTLSRILTCWLPAFLLIIDFKIFLQYSTPETSHYVGFRIFQISFACFPLLVFNLTEIKRIVLAFSVPLTAVLLFDNILEAMGIGYQQMGLTDSSYFYNTFRTFISLVVVASSFLFLKKTIEKQEMLNARLIQELAEKNALLKRKSEDELSTLNRRLDENVEELLRSEKELDKAYARLSFHINNTPLAVIERDKDFRITFWNKRAEDLLGWSEAEALGKKPTEFLLHPEDYAINTKQMSEALAEKKSSVALEMRTIAKNGAVLHCIWFYSFVRDQQGELETILSFVSDVSEQRRANYFLNERIKELRTLYNVSQLLTTSDKSMEEVFAQFPKLLGPGWQYPEVCAARLTVFSKVYQTENFVDTSFKQSTQVAITPTESALIDVVYLEEKPREFEGPFYKEERDLLEAIARMLQVYIQRKFEEEELTKAQANLASTINNTEIMIWSVDQNFDLLTFNEPFRQYNLATRGIVVKPGINHRTYFEEPARAKWDTRYLQALSGQIVVIEETLNGHDLRFSLSPIIEKGKVIGVSVFADDITEQNVKNRELAEANRKIADLKVMALRSVMNPHFIFNVLSSIQYFITRSDELNAINYLTSFSKLMRTVLTRSTADAVTVREEVDLLQDYIRLEMLRFEDKFDFSIQYQPELEIDDLKIPSLLIQPYVENAILHGLYNKEGKGHLGIRISRDGDFLVIDIEDDGVGREAAARIRERNQTTRKSMGTQLTEERLRLLNGDGEPVKYTDVFNGTTPAGTRVTILVKTNSIT